MVDSAAFTDIASKLRAPWRCCQRAASGWLGGTLAAGCELRLCGRIDLSSAFANGRKPSERIRCSAHRDISDADLLLVRDWDGGTLHALLVS